MTAPQRIVWTRADRLAGRRLPQHTRLTTRSSRWGNPYPVCGHRTQAEAVEAFAMLLATRVDDPARWCECMGRRGPFSPWRLPADYPGDDEIRARLAGWNLACVCPTEPCHASVLLVLANTQDPPSRLLLAAWRRQPATSEEST